VALVGDVEDSGTFAVNASSSKTQRSCPANEQQAQLLQLTSARLIMPSPSSTRSLGAGAASSSEGPAARRCIEPRPDSAGISSAASRTEVAPLPAGSRPLNHHLPRRVHAHLHPTAWRCRFLAIYQALRLSREVPRT
jgi:hypothetical protein